MHFEGRTNRHPLILSDQAAGKVLDIRLPEQKSVSKPSGQGSQSPSQNDDPAGVTFVSWLSATTPQRTYLKPGQYHAVVCQDIRSPPAP